MMHVLRIPLCSLLCFLLSFSGLTQGEETGELHLHGKVVNERKRGIQAQIYIYQNGQRIDQFETSRIGRFQYSVGLQDSIYLVAQAPEYVTKTILINTSVPRSRASEDYAFPFFMDLFPVGRTPSYIDLDRPVGRVVFSGVQFIYDIEYTEKQNKDLKEFVRERRDLKVRKIKENE